MIDEFNSNRYPLEISRNLGSVHWPRGLQFGANYAWKDGMVFHLVLKNRRQFIQAPYTSANMYRQYLFRASTVELGMMVPIQEERFFDHFVGAGLLLGVMGAYTAYTGREGYHGSGKMFSIDHTGILGLSLSYEAQLRLHEHFQLFLRPVAQFALNSPTRRLSEFMDPLVDPAGKVTGYGPGLGDKYSKASFNGLGFEGGLLFLLPEF
jgi:hypothetical protein